MYEASLRFSTNLTYMPTPDVQQENIIPQQEKGILDSGATHLYIAPSTPYGPPDTSDVIISVGTENGQGENLSEKATLPTLQLAAYFPTKGYIMLSFTNTIIGVGTICDAD